MSDLAKLLFPPGECPEILVKKSTYLAFFKHNGTRYGARLARPGEVTRGWVFDLYTLRIFLNDPDDFSYEKWDHREFPGWYDLKTISEFAATELETDDDGYVTTCNQPDIYLTFERVS